MIPFFRRSLSIKQKFLLGIFSIIFITGITTFFLVHSVVSNMMSGELRKRQLYIGQNIVNGSTNLLLTGNYLELQDSIDNIKNSDNDIEYVFVTDQNDKVLVDTFSGSVPHELLSANKIKSRENPQWLRLLTEQGEFLDLALPVLNGDIGSVRLGMSGRSIEKNKKTIDTVFFAIFMCVSAIGWATALLITKKITVPITELTRITKDISDNNLHKEINVQSSDEVGQLSKSFNQMVKRLRETIVSRDELAKEINSRILLEKELREREERYRLLFNNVSDAVFVHKIPNEANIPGTGRFIEVNDNSCRYLGYTREELLQMNVVQIDAPETLPNVPNILKRLLEEGRAKWEGIHLSKDGRRIPVEITNQLFELNGELTIMASVRDISDRKLADYAIRRSEEKFRTLFNSAGDSTGIFDMNGRFLEVNEAMCEKLGYKREELLLMTRMDIDIPENAAAIQKRIEEVQRRGSIVTETAYVHRNGTPIQVEVNCQNIDYDGSPAILSIARDITNRKIFEQMIENLRHKNELILNSVWEGILGLDSEGKHTFINPSATRMLGYKAEELIGKHSHPIWHHTKEDGSKHQEEECPIYTTCKDIGKYYVREDIFWRKDGTSLPVSYSTSNIMENDNVVGAVVIFRDITERKQAEEKIISSLREKELLLREIHHRVKNNLQILTSLISFQIKEDNEPRINQILSDCKDRIKTIAVIHEKLYQTNDFSSIEVRKLISDIAGYLVYSLRDTENQTDLILDIQDISVGIDIAIPLGLIINEIVSNSIKHAFSPDMKGEIIIDFHTVNEEFELNIHDNGIGFPKDFDVKKSESLGMYLIHTLTEQLGGSADITSSNGTTVKICFKGN